MSDELEQDPQVIDAESASEPQDGAQSPAEIAVEALQAIAEPRARAAGKRGLVPGTAHSQIRDRMVVSALVGGASVRAALKAAGYNPNSMNVRKRLNDPKSSIRRQLEKRLADHELTLDHALSSLKLQMNAESTVIQKGKRYNFADNQSRLRAIENVLKLHEKCGAIPSSDDRNQASGGISVNVTVFSKIEDK